MTFDPSVVAAVTAHMNDDHPEDNLLIVRAFGLPEASAASMAGLDENGGTWIAEVPSGRQELVVPWSHRPVTERPQIRRAVVTLYRTACERLGVTPREEHGSAPAGHAPAAAGRGPAAAADGSAEGFAARLRSATWSDHGDSEGASFMADILRGRGTLDDYAELVAQHWFLYDALEEAAGALSSDPRLATLHPEGLTRRAALDRDLVRLRGQDWRRRIAAVPATTAYVARIRAIAAEGWTAGLVAHHYTRYLGDLSGGQHIARRVSAQFGFDDAGAAFYDFGAIGDPAAFKAAYRSALDACGAELSPAEQQRMLNEVRRAYRFNTAVFEDLGAARTAA